MIAARDDTDRSARAASSFDYEDFFSVLMYYYNMSKEEIYKSSRKLLIALYQKYVKRACENIGISSDSEDTNENTNESFVLTEEDYPQELKEYTDSQRKSDKEFLSKFPQYKEHRIVM